MILSILNVLSSFQFPKYYHRLASSLIIFETPLTGEQLVELFFEVSSMIFHNIPWNAHRTMIKITLVSCLTACFSFTQGRLSWNNSNNILLLVSRITINPDLAFVVVDGWCWIFMFISPFYALSDLSDMFDGINNMRAYTHSAFKCSMGNERERRNERRNRIIIYFLGVLCGIVKNDEMCFVL